MDTTETLIEREAAHCRTCGQQFSAAIFRHPLNASRLLSRQLHCEPCIEVEKQRMATAEATRRTERAEGEMQAAWERICPDEFRNRFEGGKTDEVRLEREQPLLRDILAHPLGSRGLILRGPTGAAKTRCMFRLVRRYFCGSPRPRIIAMSAGRFDREARDAAGTFTLTKWFEKLAHADVFFLDDLGKGRWTEATSGQFWELVDDRTKHGRPIFLTTNLTGETLVETLGLQRDIAEPLMRRLRENCASITMQRCKS